MKHVLSTGTMFATALSLTACSLFSSTPSQVPANPSVYEPSPVSETVSPSTHQSSQPTHPSHHSQVMGHDAMVKVQQALQDKHYYWGKVDGVNGSETQNAVSAFQHDLGVPMTGVVGHKEWSALGL